MADIKLIRAKEERVPAHRDGQLIFTDEGNAYVDFPDQRIGITGQTYGDAKNQIAYSDPDDLSIEYTHTNGAWTVTVLDNQDEENPYDIEGSKSFVHYEDEDRVYTKEFNSGTSSKAKFRIHSATSLPSGVEISEISLTRKIPFSEPENLIQDNGWIEPDANTANMVTATQGAILISSNYTIWGAYIQHPITVIPNTDYRVKVNISNVTRGGVNLFIRYGDAHGAWLQPTKYFAKNGEYIYEFNSEDYTQLCVSFEGSGTSAGDEVTINSISVTTFLGDTISAATSVDTIKTPWSAENSWSDWGDGVLVDGQPTLYFSKAPGWYTVSRTVKVKPYQPYRLSITVKAVSSGLNFYIYDANNNIIAKRTFDEINHGNWTTQIFDIAPPTPTCTLKIFSFGPDTGVNTEVYVKDLTMVHLHDGNLIKNPNFTENWYNNGELQTGTYYWKLGAGGSIREPGAVYLNLSPSNTHTYVLGCDQDIALAPHTDYVISYKVKSLINNRIWSDYITFTPSDKVDFMSNIPNNEAAYFGGPWTGDPSTDHWLRFSLKGNNKRKIRTKALGIEGIFCTTKQIELQLYVKRIATNGAPIGEMTLLTLPVEKWLGESKLYTVPLQLDFDENTVVSVTLSCADINYTNKGKNRIQHVFLYGESVWQENVKHNDPYWADANQNLHVANNLIAQQINATIDDGNIDWRDL